mmetsp:Transcript_9198/g.24247  ORF Transcript_9198/g.24247 Transcript_9198/m.24247 type:complete len:91 (+) Transcript_9198:146-418(+)
MTVLVEKRALVGKGLYCGAEGEKGEGLKKNRDIGLLVGKDGSDVTEKGCSMAKSAGSGGCHSGGCRGCGTRELERKEWRCETDEDAAGCW